MKFKLKESYAAVVSRMQFLQEHKARYRNDKEFAPFQVEFREGQPMLRLSLGRSVQYFELNENGEYLMVKCRVSGRDRFAYTGVFLVDCYLFYLERNGGVHGILLVGGIVLLQVQMVCLSYRYGQRCAGRFVRKYLIDQIEVD